MTFCCEWEEAQKEAGRSIKRFGFLKQDWDRDEGNADWKCTSMRNTFQSGSNTARTAAHGHQPTQDTASLGQPSNDGCRSAWSLEHHGKLGRLRLYPLAGIRRLANTSHARSATSTVGIPGISHWQNGSLSWITSLWETLIGSPIQCPRREKGTLVVGLSLAY